MNNEAIITQVEYDKLIDSIDTNIHRLGKCPTNSVSDISCKFCQQYSCDNCIMTYTNICINRHILSNKVKTTMYKQAKRLLWTAYIKGYTYGLIITKLNKLIDRIAKEYRGTEYMYKTDYIVIINRNK